MCVMTHSYVCHDSFICVSWLIHMCVMTHSYVCHDSFIFVSWLIHMCVLVCLAAAWCMCMWYTCVFVCVREWELDCHSWHTCNSCNTHTHTLTRTNYTYLHTHTQLHIRWIRVRVCVCVCVCVCVRNCTHIRVICVCVRVCVWVRGVARRAACLAATLCVHERVRNMCV